jgi:hypothetical protein
LSRWVTRARDRRNGQHGEGAPTTTGLRGVVVERPPIRT